MSSDIFNYPLIEPILSNYPKSQWSRLIIAFTVYGIHSLSPYYSLSKLSLNELESICGVPAENLSLQPTSVSGFMRELSDIKDEIFRLNRKIDQKSIEMRVPLTTRTKTNKINFDSNGVSSKANRDYKKSPKTWRNNKIGAKSHSTRHKELYPLWFNDKGRLIERKEEKSALKTNKVNRNIPLYLKNVQSKILPQIEKDKLEYNMKEHFTNPNKLANAEKEINEQIENGEDNDKIMNHQEDASPSKSQSESVSKSQSKSQSQVEENNENSQEDAESDLLTLGRKDVRFADIADKYLDRKSVVEGKSVFAC